MSNKHRGEKGEKKVADVLESISEPHYVLHDVTLRNPASELTHQLDHILIHPHGLFVIETKNYSGTIIMDEISGTWKKLIHGHEERFFSPIAQNKSHVRTLRKALKSKYHPIGLVVFVQNNAPYLPDENVINLDDLLLFIDAYPYPKRFTILEMDEIKRLIESVAVDVPKEKHLENIAILRQVRKEAQAEMTYAIERRLCPRCDAPIEEKDYAYHCPKCGYSFKL